MTQAGQMVDFEACSLSTAAPTLYPSTQVGMKDSRRQAYRYQILGQVQKEGSSHENGLSSPFILLLWCVLSSAFYVYHC